MPARDSSEDVLVVGVCERDGVVIATDATALRENAGRRVGVRIAEDRWNWLRNWNASELDRWDKLGFHSEGSRSDLPSCVSGGILVEGSGAGGC